jgi:hypothetical protein
MGTDYFLVDPRAKVVKYIDRAGSDFACIHPGPEYKSLAVWPEGPVRVVTPSCIAAVSRHLQQDPETCYSGTPDALEWCRGRKLVLLVDDSSPKDEASHDFCHQVVFGGVEGWTGEDDTKKPRLYPLKHPRCPIVGCKAQLVYLTTMATLFGFGPGQLDHNRQTEYFWCPACKLPFERAYRWEPSAGGRFAKEAAEKGLI